MPPAVPPPRPRLVFRLGFAGHRDLGRVGTAGLTQILTGYLQEIANILLEVPRGKNAVTSHPENTASTTPPTSTPPLSIGRFYSDEPPLLRLVTGLCEGADQAAADALALVSNSGQPLNTDSPRIATALAAVLPCDVATYRGERPSSHLPDFDRAAANCEYIATLDGLFPGNSPTPAATPQLESDRKDIAYRTQGAVLCRHSDLLIAVGDASRPARPGGTIETVRAALQFEIPVLFIDLAKLNTPETPNPDTAVRLLDPGDDFLTPDMLRLGSQGDWKVRLRDHIRRVVDLDGAAAHEQHHASALNPEEVLREYFQDENSASDSGLWTPFSPLKRWWPDVVNRFKPKPKDRRRSKDDLPLQPFSDYAGRAEELNMHYTALYRGTFTMNSIYAVGVITLATISLAIQATYGEWYGGAGNAAASDNKMPCALWGILLLFGLIKIVLLREMIASTGMANDLAWNDRAVDLRYLAERLRAMNYLPLVGSFQPPVASPSQYASRVLRQSAIDWLFEAVVRSVPFRSLRNDYGPLLRTDLVAPVGAAPYNVRILPVDPAAALAIIRDHWIDNQGAYHHNTSTTYGNLDIAALQLLKRLAPFAFWAILVEEVYATLEQFGWLQGPFDLAGLFAGAQLLTVTAGVASAFTPAINSFRFQSESQRLHERYRAMRRLLGGPDAPTGLWSNADHLIARIQTETAKPQNPGAWTLPALRLTEDVAAEFVREVAEWSTLYDKDVADLS